MFHLGFLLFVLPYSCPPSLSEHLEGFNLTPYVGESQAALAIFDLEEDRWIRFDKDRCALRSTPCSTFKIFNSLVGLDSGVLKDTETTYPWDGTKQFSKAWERDHTLKSAFKNSVVWYYKKLARDVGSERMQSYLDRADYGNRNISGGIDRFWLGDSFKVSPNEQVVLLKRLYRNELPFSMHAMETVRKIMVDEELSSKYATVSGKTGSDWDDGTFIQGWYVGHYEGDNYRFVFALCMVGDGYHGPHARKVMKQILGDLQMLPGKNEKM